MKIKMDHVNLTVEDIKISSNWYRSVFGMELLEKGETWDHRPWAIMGKDDTMVCMTEKTGHASPGEGRDAPAHQIFHFGLRTDNEEQWRQIVKDQQLELYYGGINEYPHSRSWYVKDPTGHTIEVSFAFGQPLRFD